MKYGDLALSFHAQELFWREYSRMTTTPIEVFIKERAGHAESPLWSPTEGALYWVDTVPGTIYRIDLKSGKRDAWPTPTRLGAIGLRRNGLIMAIKTGIGFLDTESGTYEPVVDTEADQPETRINDAKKNRSRWALLVRLSG